MLYEGRYFPRPRSDASEDLNLRHSKFIQLMLPLSYINVAGMARGKETDDIHYSYLPRCWTPQRCTAIHNCTAVQFSFPSYHFQCLEQLVIQCRWFQLSTHLLRIKHRLYFRKTFRKKINAYTLTSWRHGIFFLQDALMTFYNYLHKLIGEKKN